MQMFAQIENTFKIKLPLATLYEAPMIEELAKILRGETAGSGWSPLVAIQVAGERCNARSPREPEVKSL